MSGPIHRLVEKVRKNEPIPIPIAAMLSTVTPITRLGMLIRLHRGSVRVSARVISFGNLTAGGTGKTPATIERARIEIAAGRRVAVLTRGYRSKQGAEPFVARGLDAVSNLCGAIGDEGVLILKKAPGVILVKSPDRVAAARVAIEEHGCDTLLLDDGFQHVRIERDENVLLIDATNPFGNGHLVPRGILRESIEGMTRATSICFTRCDQAKSVQSAVETVRRIHPNVSIRFTRHAPVGVWRLLDGESMPLSTLQGSRVRAVCGIANPEAFFRTLTSVGAQISEQQCFLDHAPIPGSALNYEGAVIMTEKDAVRILSGPERIKVPENALALSVELQDIDPVG